MSDPAIDAAKRAWSDRYGPEMLSRFADKCDSDDDVAAFVTAAAREALAPIKKLHQPVWLHRGRPICRQCMSGLGEYLSWPCSTARLAYAAEELAATR